MSVLHRALLSWFNSLIFLIMLVLRLDERTRWSWFVIFIPLWIHDCILLFRLLFTLITRCKGAQGGTFQAGLKEYGRNCWYLCCAFLKLAFEIMVCLRLEKTVDLPMYYIMLPIWIVLPVTSVDLMVQLRRFKNYV